MLGRFLDAVASANAWPSHNMIEGYDYSEGPRP